MKTLFFLASLFSFSAFSQFLLDFPDDFEYNTEDNYNLSRLGFTEVVQYQTVETEEAVIAPCYLNYVVNLNAKSLISSVKYSMRSPPYNLGYFNIRNPEYLEGLINDTLNYYQYEYADSMRVFGYYEYEFIYEGHALNTIEIHTENNNKFGKYSGIIDGIYLRPDSSQRTITNKTVNADNQILTKTVQDKDDEIHRWKYYYTKYPFDNYTISLLTKIEYDFRGTKLYTHLDYRK